MNSDKTPAASATPYTPASPDMDEKKLKCTLYWKPGDPPGKPEKPEEWKLVRTCDWSFDIKDPHGFPPPNTFLDDYLACKIIGSELPNEEWSWRWPINFLPGGHLNWNLQGVGRAAKVKIQGVWYYVRYKGVELHGQEGRQAGLPRRVKISTSGEPNTKTRTCDLTSDFPSSPNKKIRIREEIREEEDDDTTMSLKRAVTNYQELFLKADEMMDQLFKARNINACLNAWREIATQYNLLSEDAQKLL